MGIFCTHDPPSIAELYNPLEWSFCGDKDLSNGSWNIRAQALLKKKKSQLLRFSGHNRRSGLHSEPYPWSSSSNHNSWICTSFCASSRENFYISNTNEDLFYWSSTSLSILRMSVIKKQASCLLNSPDTVACVFWLSSLPNYKFLTIYRFLMIFTDF